MTELDPDLLKLVQETPPQTLEHLVLGHVRLRSDAGFVRVEDLQGHEILRIPRRSENYKDRTVPTARLIAEALLSAVICGACGKRLIEGEDGVCTLCEARQVAELFRIAEDLSE